MFVIQELDEVQLMKDLEELFNLGIDSLAVVLAHSYTLVYNYILFKLLLLLYKVNNSEWISFLFHQTNYRLKAHSKSEKQFCKWLYTYFARAKQ